METEERPRAITKILTRNDTGESGTHQAGILIPKDPRILAFFPALNPEEKNPRQTVSFQGDNSREWQFAFIYYNNRFFGGTRNEYRLTCMTPYLKMHSLTAGDRIVLSRDTTGLYRIMHERELPPVTGPVDDIPLVAEREVLKLGLGWKEIRI